jgi:NADH-quinone oxidoreductase subunit J
VLIYVGAIGVLIIFGIMLTRESRRGSPSGRLRPAAMLVAVMFLGAMIAVIVGTNWNVASTPSVGPTTSEIATSIFGQDGFVLAFEIAGALMLAAVIGAIVLMRDK